MRRTTLLLLLVRLLIQPVSVEKRSQFQRILADLLLCGWSIHFIHPPSWAFELLDRLLLHTTLQPLAVCPSLHLSYTREVPSQKWNCGVKGHLQVTTSSLYLVAPFDEWSVFIHKFCFQGPPCEPCSPSRPHCASLASAPGLVALFSLGVSEATS